MSRVDDKSEREALADIVTREVLGSAYEPSSGRFQAFEKKFASMSMDMLRALAAMADRAAANGGVKVDGCGAWCRSCGKEIAFASEKKKDGSVLSTLVSTNGEVVAVRVTASGVVTQWCAPCWRAMGKTL